MKIGVVGNYGNNNQGDEAILHGILIQLGDTFRVERRDITVFTNNPELTRNNYGVKTEKLYYKRRSAPMTVWHTVSKQRSIIANLDLLIIGGGGILMDLYRSNAVIFGMYGWMAKRVKTPFIIYGAGAGPISTWFGKRIMQSLVNNAELVMVRDDKSKDLLRQIGVNNPVHVIGDPAFQMKKPVQPTTRNEALKIGVTAVPYYHGSYWPTENEQKYKDYIRGMAGNLDKLLAAHPKATVQFFATKHPQDTGAAKDIKQQMTYENRCNIYDQTLSHLEIVDLISKQDILIGTRLHSLILALVAHTLIIAISYHHKVKDFMETIDATYYLVDIESIHQRDDYFQDIYDAMDINWDVTKEKFQTSYEQMRLKSEDGMKLAKQIVEGRK